MSCAPVWKPAADRLYVVGVPRDVGEAEGARSVGGRGLLVPRDRVLDGDGGAGDRRAGRVDDAFR